MFDFGDFVRVEERDIELDLRGKFLDFLQMFRS